MARQVAGRATTLLAAPCCCGQGGADVLKLVYSWFFCNRPRGVQGPSGSSCLLHPLTAESALFDFEFRQMARSEKGITFPFSEHEDAALFSPIGAADPCRALIARENRPA